jgi:hypothetical protein
MMPMGSTFNQIYYCNMIMVTVTLPDGSPAVDMSPYLNAQVHAGMEIS